MNLYKELMLLTDAEAELCLNGVLKGVALTESRYAELFARPCEMAAVIEEVASDVGSPLGKIGDVTPQGRPKAIRVVLAELADDSDLARRLEAWLETARPKLLEPVTSALVLAGIITVLSTHVSIDYEEKDGKRHLKVKVEKKPTATKILQRFFGFFK